MGLLTDFHKIAGFRPNMLVSLNSTFTFAKQAEDNIIRRKFQCKPTHAFIQSFSCPLSFEESRGSINIRRN